MPAYIDPEMFNTMAGQAMGPTPQVSLGGGGGPDWNLIAMMLGRGAQAFAPPGTWQHGVGGLGAGLGESGKYAEAATKARGGERSDLAEAIRMLAMGGTPFSAKGVPGPSSMKVDSKGEMMIGYTPDRDIFGIGPLATMGVPQLEEPSPTMGYGEPSPTGGPGGQSATVPFTQKSPRPTDLLQPIW